MTEDVIKQRIEDEIKKTEAIIKSYQQDTKPVAPDCAIDLVSRMDAFNTLGVTEAAFKKAKVKLSNLQYVLSKTDDPDFGKCIKCGKAIAVERIIARPESFYCVDCASR